MEYYLIRFAQGIYKRQFGQTIKHKPSEPNVWKVNVKLEAMRGNDAVFCDNHMAFHEAFVCSFGFMFPFLIA